MYDRIRSAFGITPTQPAGAGLENEWVAEASGKGFPRWPLLLYGSLVLVAPYLLWKTASAEMEHADGDNGAGWTREEEECFEATALHDFAPAEGSHEVALKRGEKVLVAPRHKQPRVRGWLLCCADGSGVGLAPANYLRVTGRKRPSGVGQQCLPTRPDVLGSAPGDEASV